MLEMDWLEVCGSKAKASKVNLARTGACRMGLNTSDRSAGDAKGSQEQKERATDDLSCPCEVAGEYH